MEQRRNVTVVRMSSLGAIRFGLGLALLLLLAHTTAYFCHEYSHSFVAWILGFKADPLNLDYGHLDLANILFQQEIDERVDYAPIFAAHDEIAAATIALAGIGIGNLVTYILVQLAFLRGAFARAPRFRSFLFWFLLIDVANVWSYVPIRTVTTHADIATAVRALAMSPWFFLAFAIVPVLAMMAHFFLRVLPYARASGVLGDDLAERSGASAVACYILFGIFGGAVAIGGNYGPTAAVFAIISAIVVAPVLIVVEMRKAAQEAI